MKAHSPPTSFRSILFYNELRKFRLTFSLFKAAEAVKKIATEYLEVGSEYEANFDSLARIDLLHKIEL